MLAHHVIIALLTALLTALILTPSAALACSPSFPHGELELSFPAMNAIDLPFNAPLTLRWEEVGVPANGSDISQSAPLVMVSVRAVDSSMDIAQGFWSTPDRRGEGLITLSRPLQPHTSYAITAQVSEEFGAQRPGSWSFRTGSDAITYPPKLDFAGLETLRYTERATPSQDCCPVSELGACQTCAQTGWTYQPVIEVAFNQVQSEHPVRYAIYEHDSLDPRSARTLLEVVHSDKASTRSFVTLPRSSAQETICVSVVAQYYTATDIEDLTQTPITCITPERFEPLARLDENFPSLTCREDTAAPGYVTDSDLEEPEGLGGCSTTGGSPLKQSPREMLMWMACGMVWLRRRLMSSP